MGNFSPLAKIIVSLEDTRHNKQSWNILLQPASQARQVEKSRLANSGRASVTMEHSTQHYQAQNENFMLQVIFNT